MKSGNIPITLGDNYLQVFFYGFFVILFVSLLLNFVGLLN